jgi:hypothetical protein
MLRIQVPERRTLPRFKEGIPSFHLGTRSKKRERGKGKLDDQVLGRILE